MSNVSANKIDKINSLGHHVQLVWFLGINFTLFDLYFNLESQVDLKFPQEFDSNSKWFVQNKHERVSLGNCLIPQTVKAGPDCCDQWKCTNWVLKSSSQEEVLVQCDQAGLSPTPQCHCCHSDLRLSQAHNFFSISDKNVRHSRSSRINALLSIDQIN